MSRAKLNEREKRKKVHITTDKIILKEAKRFFWYCGFDRTTIRDIAKASGCTPGNIYNHFSSKEEILFRVMLEEMDRVNEKVHLLQQKSSASSTDQLKAYIYAFLESMLEPLEEGFMNFEMEIRYLLPHHRKQIIKKRDEHDSLLRTIINRGIRAGIFAPMNVKIVDFAIIASIVRTRIWYSKRGKLSIKEIANCLSEFFIQGLLSRSKFS